MASTLPDVELYARERPRLLAHAYRMLGSLSEAEDVVQDAYLRWQAEPSGSVLTPAAWLTTVVTRLCLDVLKSARARREQYVGPWLPEPASALPEGAVERDPNALSFAFLLVLETLSPLERAAFLLGEVFDYSYAEIAVTLERDEAACRKLAQRAREHLAARRPRCAPSREAHERVLQGFVLACSTGDVQALSRMLAHDATAASDSGGKVRAAHKVLHGNERIARFLMGVQRHGTAGLSLRFGEVNGLPSMILLEGERVHSVLTLETDGALIYAVHMVLNPDKLHRVQH